MLVAGIQRKNVKELPKILNTDGLWNITVRLRQNGSFIADEIFKIFFNENMHILIQISLRFVPKVPINIGWVPNRRQAII